ncbi:unnamed protein product [Lepidochelys kempii]
MERPPLHEVFKISLPVSLMLCTDQGKGTEASRPFPCFPHKPEKVAARSCGQEDWLPLTTTAELLITC